ncbi:putative short-chain dehydrogenases/reductase [Stipitochalara longipes BDJ]|nr:putative short-chain dehydrogenases/reductase [Stipitochalara longipes BDJ]
MSRLLHFLTQAWSPPANPTTSFAGKTVIITGANSGLGFEAAVKLHQLGCSCLVVGVRDLTKGEAAKKEILRRTGVGAGGGTIEVWKCDMDDYESLLAFSEKVEGLERVDCVVLNAGIFGVAYKVGRYSWEEVLQVNVLSTALLGILLLPKLKASRREGEAESLPVLEFVGSDGHELVSIEQERREEQSLLGSYNKPESFNSRTQYQTSKLFVMYVMQTLASLAKSPDGKLEALVLAVCPGGAQSNLSRGYEGVVADVVKWILGSLFLRTAEQGARTLVSGLLLGKESQGGFWQSDVIKEPAPLVASEEGEGLRKRVWSEIVEALEKDIPTVRKVLRVIESF